MRLAAHSLLRVYMNADDMDSWDALSLASTLGGMVIHSAGITALHGMEHPVSGLKNAELGSARRPCLLQFLLPVRRKNSLYYPG